MYRKYRKAYHVHKGHAKGRGIPWLFTYTLWITIWEHSGHLHERGRKKGQYCMSRPNDEGPYSPDNVRIVQVGINVSEAELGWPQKRDPHIVEIHKRKTSRTLTGRRLTKEHRQNMSRAHRRRFASVRGAPQAKA